MRFVASLAAAFAVLGAAPPSDAEPSKAECLDAYRVSQPLRHDGKLLRARDKLLMCARDPCPAVLQKDCLDWLHEVEASLPSLVIGATSASGDDVQDVTVWMDGATIASRIDGRAIDVDPGPHHFKLEHANARPIERDVVVREGDKGRRLDVRFEPSTSVIDAVTVTPAIRRPVGWPTIVVGIAGIVGVATMAGFGISGIVLRSNLDDCKPNCPDATRLSPIRTDFLVADVMGAVSLAIVATAIVLFVTRPTLRDVRAWNPMPLRF